MLNNRAIGNAAIGIRKRYVLEKNEFHCGKRVKSGFQSPIPAISAIPALPALVLYSRHFHSP